MASVSLCLKFFAVVVFLLSVAFPVWLSEFAGGWTRAYLSKWSPSDIPNLHGKTALVTGANTGIGRTTALNLAQAGATVLVHARTEKKAAMLVAEIRQLSGKAEAISGDLSSFSSVVSLAEQVTRLAGGRLLDIAILNAGLCKDCMGKTDAGFELTSDGFELHIQVNHLSHQLLVEKLLATKTLALGSRLVSVSSSLEQISYPEGMRYGNWREKGTNYTDGSAYGQSKLANVYMAQEVYKRFGIESVSVHPGIIASELSRYTLDGAGMMKKLGKSLFSLAQMNVEHGSWSQLWTATAPGLKQGNFHPVAIEHPADHPAAADHVASAKCWDSSHDILSKFM